MKARSSLGVYCKINVQKESQFFVLFNRPLSKLDDAGNLKPMTNQELPLQTQGHRFYNGAPGRILSKPLFYKEKITDKLYFKIVTFKQSVQGLIGY